MIPQAYITAWAARAPWARAEQIEQDLILSRLIVEIAGHPLLAEELAFRGGTCLHKLHLPKPLRYSEDLDYVRTSSEPRLGECFDALREIARGVGLVEGKRRFPSAASDMGTIWFDGRPTSGIGRIRIKLETNVEETEPLDSHAFIEYTVRSPWWTGTAPVRTFCPEEILGTKIRALCERRKGRDLFDIWAALTQLDLDDGRIIAALSHYTGTKLYSFPQLRRCLEGKLIDAAFLADLHDLTTDLGAYDADAAAKLLLERIGVRLRNVPEDLLS